MSTGNLFDEMEENAKRHKKNDHISCTVVGDCKTGKTWLTVAFAHRRFPCDSKYTETYLEQRTGVIAVSERQHTVNVFDTSGRHEHEDMRAVCYRKSDVIVVCFSAVNKTSFNSVKTFWLPEIKSSLGDEEKPIILVGCQTELRRYGSKPYNSGITSEEGKSLAKDLGLDFFIECSAMALVGVRDVFENVVWSVLKTRSCKTNIVKTVRQIKDWFNCVSVQTLQ